MRIQEFANYFNVKKTTIRYYSDIHLLIPKKINGYFDYCQQCCQDMNDIIRLKNMGFSIKEIQFFKAYERFNINYTNEERTFLNKKFDNKILELKNQIVELSSQIKAIKEYKKNLANENTKKALGLPLNSLELLSCDLCDSSFRIEKASIEDNMVFSGVLKCSCGKILHILDGIISELHDPALTEKNKHTINIRLKNNMPQITNAHISQIKATGNWISDNIKNWNHDKGILIANADFDFIIMNTDEIFKEDGIYFLGSCNPESIKTLKSKMERLQIKGSFVFMYISQHYPINKSVPYVIDYGGNICNENKSPFCSMLRLSPLINNQSTWLNIHVIMSNSPYKSCENLSGYFPIIEFKKKYRDIGMAVYKEDYTQVFDTFEYKDFVYSNMKSIQLIMQALRPPNT